MTFGQEIFPRFDLFMIVTLSLITAVKQGPATTRAARVIKHREFVNLKNSQL